MSFSITKYPSYRSSIPNRTSPVEKRAALKQHIDFNKPLFTGGLYNEPVRHPDIAGNVLITETSFFREANTLEFVKEYIAHRLKRCTGPVEIADYACSSGEEAYTFAMLTEELPGKDRIKICGYDLSRKALRDANSGEVTISRYQTPFIGKLRNLLSTRIQHTSLDDAFVLLSLAELQDFKFKDIPRKQHYGQLFRESCTSIGSSQEQVKIEGGKTHIVERFHYRLNPDLKNRVQFEEPEKGDITQIQANRKPNSTDIILFRNALYHLITEEDVSKRQIKNPQEVRAILLSLFHNIYSTLRPGGIFVLGEEENPQVRGQKFIIDKYLLQAGFEPLYAGQKETNIWQKPQT